MKKYLTLLIVVITLSFSLCIPSFASAQKVITLSEDYKYMYFDGSTYTRVDASMLSFNEEQIVYKYVEKYDEDSLYTEFHNTVYEIELTDIQKEEIKKIGVENNNQDETLFFITIYFVDGSELYIDFIREDMLDEYEKAISGNTEKYTVDFMWPEGNKFQVNKEKLFKGNKRKVDVLQYESHRVYSNLSTNSFSAYAGLIFSDQENYYFFSFIDSNLKTEDEFLEQSYYGEKTEVIELTDEELIENLKTCEQKYFEDDYGYLYNKEFTETVSKIFFVLIFAIAPAVVFVGSLILAIKSKKALYKKLLFVTSGISLAVIVTFIYIAFTLFNT